MRISNSYALLKEQSMRITLKLLPFDFCWATEVFEIRKAKNVKLATRR
jgi:hypothetical protein